MTSQDDASLDFMNFANRFIREMRLGDLVEEFNRKYAEKVDGRGTLILSLPDAPVSAKAP